MAAASDSMLVVTPTLGESPWLDATVSSVASLPVPVRHVLVCPTRCISRLASEHPGVQVCGEPGGGGMYAAINAVLERGDWDAFTYINDDDLLLPGFARAADEAGKGGELLVYGRVLLVDGSGVNLGRIPVSPWPLLNRALYAQRIEPVYQHGTVITRAAWERCGGFDPDFKLCGDSEYLARLCIAGVRAVRVPAPVAAFRLRPGQMTKSRAAMLAERRRVDEKLGLLSASRPSFAARLAAKLLFRLANAPAYLGRIRRFGVASFDDVLVRGGM